jgi:hypothetical protein
VKVIAFGNSVNQNGTHVSSHSPVIQLHYTIHICNEIWTRTGSNRTRLGGGGINEIINHETCFGIGNKSETILVALPTLLFLKSCLDI